ncbi:MAG: SDR family NAD(P)-dependent oxidoreductase [Casimicrobiaceae bacterium]
MTNVAFVTGVSRGLGAALATQLLAAGWTVFGIGRKAPPGPAHPQFNLLEADLADVGRSTRMALAAMRGAAAASPVRALLVNNAAVAEPVARIGELDADALRSSLAVNLVAPVALANAFCRAFDNVRVERRVINVSSGLAARALAGASLYSIAKCAMEMLTNALCVDHPESSFAAVTLRPGIIDTGMQVAMRTQPAANLPDVAMFRDFHDSGRLVAAEHVAKVVLATLVDRAVSAGTTYSYADLAASIA